MSNQLKNSPKVLGLDISTKTTGWALFDIQQKNLLELERPKSLWIAEKLFTENKNVIIRYIFNKARKLYWFKHQ